MMESAKPNRSQFSIEGLPIIKYNSTSYHLHHFLNSKEQRSLGSFSFTVGACIPIYRGGISESPDSRDSRNGTDISLKMVKKPKTE